MRSAHQQPEHGRRTPSGLDGVRESKEAPGHQDKERSHMLARTPARQARQLLDGPQRPARRLSAQSPSACSPRRPNSRQRRSANRLVEYVRSKQGPQSAAAELTQTATPKCASPKRTHEDGVRRSGGSVEDGAAASRRRIVDVDYEARQEAAAALYTAWRQHALATTTSTSPKRALEDGAQEGSVKRGGGQRWPVNPGNANLSGR